MNSIADSLFPALTTIVSVWFGHWISGKNQAREMKRAAIVSQRESAAQFLSKSQDLMAEQEQADPTFYGRYGSSTDNTIETLAEKKRRYFLEMTKALEALDLYLHNTKVRQAFTSMEKTVRSDLSHFEESAAGLIYLGSLDVPGRESLAQEMMQSCVTADFFQAREHFLKTARENLILVPKKF